LKPDIHPEYPEVTIVCTCGNKVQTRSTIASLHVGLCSKCHPFYTGKRQLINEKGGRIEQFKRRYGQQQEEAAKA
jgi:large subunit ribosomal protein L31